MPKHLPYVKRTSSISGLVLLCALLAPAQADPGRSRGIAEDASGRIVFVSDRDGDFDLYVKPAAGGPSRRLTSNHKDEYEPRWSPDGTQVVFVREAGPDGRNGELFLKTLGAGPAVRLLAQRSRSYEGDPAWSADGEWISYASEGAGDGGSTYVVNVHTKKGTWLALESDNSVVGKGTWSPHDGEFAFVDTYGGSKLWITTFPERSTAERLHGQGQLQVRNLDWSPDGSKLLFARGNDLDWDLYTYDFESDSQSPLREEDAEQALDPLGQAEKIKALSGSWSPDGSMIAYYSDKEGTLSIS